MSKGRGFVDSGPGRSRPASDTGFVMRGGLTVLRSRDSMKVDLHTQAIFTGPLERFKDILPAGAGHERFVGPRLDRPERNRNSDPIQTGASNLGKILLSLKHGSSVLASV